MIFNDRIRALRLEKGMTQAQVAAAIGIAPRNYQRLEAQGQDLTPNYWSLLRLADCFGVSVDYLMGGTKNRDINRKKGKRTGAPLGCRGSFCTLISRAGSGWRGC